MNVTAGVRNNRSLNTGTQRQEAASRLSLRAGQLRRYTE